MSFALFFGVEGHNSVWGQTQIYLYEVIYKNCANKLKHAMRVVSSVQDSIVQED